MLGIRDQHYSCCFGVYGQAGIFVLMMPIPSPSHMGTSPHADNPTDMGSPHIDIHQDLFPDYYGGTASAPSAPKDEFPGNDIDNGSNKDEFPGNGIDNGSNKDEFPGNDIDNGSNDCPPPVIQENNFPAPVPLDSLPAAAPVPPGSSGQGLPYAPINWPNAGDIWSWKVGRRVNVAGIFNDRFLTVPESLRKPNAPKVFASKPMLERFIRSNFPDADVDAFFASFVWKIPAIVEPSTKAPTSSVPTEAAPAEEMEDDKKDVDKITPRRTNRKRAPPPPPFITPTPSDSQKKQKTPKGSAKSKGPAKPQGPAKSQGPAKPKRQTRQNLKNSSPPQVEIQDTNDGLDDVSFLDDETGRAEFDNYLNSLDEILVQTQPSSEEPSSQQAEMRNFFAAEGEMAEARRKLSSLLDMDFPSLICFKDLDELASLASKLRKDPTLTAEQLVKLKLIEEIPTFCEVFLENREVMEQADKFFTALDHNKAKVSSLKQEYSDLKQQVTNLQSEVDSNTMTVQDIDNQIAQLKARRAELMKLIDKKKKDKDELIYNQKLVANSIPKVVHEVQIANAKKTEWELKKDNGLRRQTGKFVLMMPIPSPSHMGTFAHTDNPIDLGIPHIDIHQDLFPDYFGGPASTLCESKHEFPGNDIYNGGNPCAPIIKESNSLPRVPPGSTGEGLPYAPIHWPNAGDIWSWRVGRKVNSYGFYSDRFLKVPESLRKPNIPKVFSSKPAVERFLQSNFPDTDVNAFFASFTWKIPAVVLLPYPSCEEIRFLTLLFTFSDRKKFRMHTDYMTFRFHPLLLLITWLQNLIWYHDSIQKLLFPCYVFVDELNIMSKFHAPIPSVSAQGMEDDKRQINERTPHVTERKRAQPTSLLSTPSSGDGKKMQKTTRELARPKQQTHQQLKDSAPLPSEIQDTYDGLDVSFLDNEMGRAEFDNYLNSLDEILVQPSFQEPF
ncbi:hypothetical protein V6N11_069177 [Hibiscus sabdariffa]|uniref:DUF7081 domain-containing protein n=1 Tax=Hibiscus sabdariffa TaxID=183260 RepID=A0ABR2NB18_9ROSI